MKRDLPAGRHARPTAPAYSLRQGVAACCGVALVIGVLAFSTFKLGVLLALGSFGSSAVLLFTFPDHHFSQPRSLVGGHFLCSAIGLLTLALFGPTWWALALAVAVGTAVMMLMRCMHPPAGSNSIIVFVGVIQDWHFLFFPTLCGTLAMVAVAVLYHRACGRTYPLYWH